MSSRTEAPWKRWTYRGREYLPALLLFAALIGSWEVLVALLRTEPWLLPAPSRIWQAFVATRALLPAHVRTTIVEALAGLALAASVGVSLALLIATVGVVRRVLYPLVVVSQTVPMIVLAPLLVIWLGFGMAPKIVVVALVGFFPIVVSTVDGLDGAEPEMVDLVRSMGASRLQALRRVLVPGAVPAFFAGLKIAAAYAIIGAVIGEWVGAQEGLGIFITRSQASYRTDQIFVAIVVIALLSIALFAVVHLLARLASPWKYAARSSEESITRGGNTLL